jgi:predicted RNase H-like nuclease (RuvC/YqgF family)
MICGGRDCAARPGEPGTLAAANTSEIPSIRFRLAAFHGKKRGEMTLKDVADLVETRLDDLQAEMEAGERCATKLHDQANGVDNRLETVIRTAERTGQMAHRVAELQRSLRQQRALMRQLRIEIKTLRAKIARGRTRELTESTD